MNQKNCVNQETFFALLRAGLWEQADANLNVDLNLNEGLNWDKVYQQAQEQSVQGLVLQGIEWLKDHNLNADLDLIIPKVLLLQWIGEVQTVEQRNREMNVFIAELIEKLRKADVYAILVKGQGIAQCYEKPLWRSSGDIDLLLSESNYEEAKKVLIPLSVIVESERMYAKHLGMTIDNWTVELHGRLTCGLTTGIDKLIDKVQDAVFYGGEVRSWQNGSTQVFLPSADNDVIFVFTHFLKHFYKEGLCLRQICDWCRLLYTYKDSLDYRLLESRIRKMGLMSEWKAFYNLASRYLGMPDLGSRLMARDSRFDKKADRIMEFILKSGNMGHNRGSWLMEQGSWLSRLYIVRKSFSMFRRIGDLINHARIFPLDSLRFFPRIMFNGVVSAIRGE